MCSFSICAGVSEEAGFAWFLGIKASPRAVFFPSSCASHSTTKQLTSFQCRSLNPSTHPHHHEVHHRCHCLCSPHGFKRRCVPHGIQRVRPKFIADRVP
ncbi:hypothetical protein M413DRAFT_191603 [Hebeloma cylindrosporum]|uniref:Uncharacterized protein n=1 Tax=Hebeloma cylindrosporum TaxID=76867 RepID=A0A0C2YEK3_HEBCY|nr:hypothetical protein M413DRAFT_191603 [Hebeloma cylindrosporum h7]